MMHSLDRRPSPLGRLVALLAAALVLMLAVLAASPELHESVHGHAAASHAPQGAAHDDDGCVVTLFAQGLVAALGILWVGALLRQLPEAPAPAAVAARVAPRYLRLPSQAPPAPAR